MTSILSWFRRLYSLDTLDTRFIVSSNTPLKVIATDTRSAPAKDAHANAVASNASPSKWRTPEFWVYYVIFLIAVPLMFITVIEVSQGMAARPRVEVNTDWENRKPSDLPNILSSAVSRLDTWAESSEYFAPCWSMPGS
jgi:hypothetical protein